MHKRFQIIKPFLSDKIIEAATLKKGAKQCYKEIKGSKVISSEFAIKDIDSKEIFRYKINNVQFGGAEEVADGQQPVIAPTVEAVEEPTTQSVGIEANSDVTKLAIMVVDLTNRVNELEKQIVNHHQHDLGAHQLAHTNVYDAQVEKLKAYRAVQDPNYADDGCSIM